jgi:hypothetical protein
VGPGVTRKRRLVDADLAHESAVARAMIRLAPVEANLKMCSKMCRFQ